MRRTATKIFLGPVHKTASGWGYEMLQAGSQPLLIQGTHARAVHKERRAAAQNEGCYLISSHDLYSAIAFALQEAHAFGKSEALQLIAQTHGGVDDGGISGQET